MKRTTPAWAGLRLQPLLLIAVANGGSDEGSAPLARVCVWLKTKRRSQTYVKSCPRTKATDLRANALLERDHALEVR